MTDDLDPSQLLASAALDDEVDAEDRARVEASPELRAELERYRSIGEELRAVEVPTAAREAAVAAALTVFDELGADDRTAGGGTAPAAAVASLQDRRRRQQLWLGRVAAGLVAAAVVAVVGVGALRMGSGEDKKSSATSPPFAETAASAAKSSPAADASLASTAAAEAPDAASQAGGASDTTAAGTVAAYDTVAAAGTAPVDPWAGAPSFTNPDELRAFSVAVLEPSSTASTEAHTAESTAGTTSGDTPTTAAAAPVTLAACVAPPGATFVPVYYGGQRAFLVRDDAAGVLRLLDAANCAEILTVPLG